MDSRERLKALQAQVAAARAAFGAGDRDKALQHLDRALAIDPSFLAARSLRERVWAKATVTLPEIPATQATPPTPVAPAAPHLSGARASREAHERIERRARQRRIDHCIAATRAALGRQQPDAAAVVLEELIALDPDESNVPSLSAELADLRRSTRRPFGVRLVAASAFFAVAGAASWLAHPPRPSRVALVTTTSRPAAVPPTVRTAPKSRKLVSTHHSVDRESKRGRLARDVTAPQPATSPRALPPPAPVTVPERARSTAAREASIGSAVPRSLPVPPSQRPPVAAATTPREPTAASTITAGPPAVERALARAPSDRELVEETLQSYRRAYGRLNVQSAQRVYPSVNHGALARAFDNLESQLLTFDMCDVELRETFARAICHGTARYTPKIGNRNPHAEALVWSFELRKRDGNWTIEYAKASR